LSSKLFSSDLDAEDYRSVGYRSMLGRRSICARSLACIHERGERSVDLCGALLTTGPAACLLAGNLCVRAVRTIFEAGAYLDGRLRGPCEGQSKLSKLRLDIWNVKGAWRSLDLQYCMPTRGQEAVTAAEHEWTILPLKSHQDCRWLVVRISCIDHFNRLAPSCSLYVARKFGSPTERIRR
jgi:hypothetical protein